MDMTSTVTSFSPERLERFIWHEGDIVLKARKYSPDQPRDDRGRFGEGDGGKDPAPDTSSPAWKDITSKIRAQGDGNCYQAAGTLMMNARELGLQNVTVVQATVSGQGELTGQRFGHSWVEADGGTAGRDAYDWSSGNSVVMPDELYRAIGRVEDVREYPEKEALMKMVETENYGPWE
jgi:hypothetical protein